MEVDLGNMVLWFCAICFDSLLIFEDIQCDTAKKEPYTLYYQTLYYETVVPVANLCKVEGSSFIFLGVHFRIAFKSVATTSACQFSPFNA